MSSVEEKLEKNKDALMKKIESVETNLGKIARFLKKGFDTKFASVDKKFASVDKKFASIKINIDTLRTIDAELETKYDYLKKMENITSRDIRNLYKKVDVNDKPIDRSSPSTNARALPEKFQYSPSVPSSRASSSSRASARGSSSLYALFGTKSSENKARAKSTQTFNARRGGRRHTRKNKK